MIVFCRLLSGVGQLVGSIVSLFLILILVSVVLSWIRPDPNNMLVRIIFGSTEPLFNIARRYIPPLGMLDLSPLVVWGVLYLISWVIGDSLVLYGMSCEASATRTITAM